VTTAASATGRVDRPGRPREVVLLGSTGSVGTQTIDIARRNPQLFRITALAAGGSRPQLLARQAVQLGVRQVGVADEGAAAAVRAALTQEVQAVAGRPGDPVELPDVLTGPDAAVTIAASHSDVVLNGMTGSIGLAPTLAALEAGRTLALANKESLIVGGDLVTRAAAPGQIVPVDSEHSAIAQCLRAGAPAELRRLVVTASGGPFRGRRRSELHDVTPEQAMAHPTWDMGPMVTTNSATLVNKGLEVIEAHLLFGVPFDRIDVVVHPQSVVHSMVEFVDGSTIAQCSPPDMRLPIALALSWPDRVPEAAPACDWTTAATWEFLPLDHEAFPAVRLARRVGAAGATYPAVFNAANEECVHGFWRGRLRFTEIVDTVARVGDDHEPPSGPLTLSGVLHAERWARSRARAILEG
jgi:1-deoxy-D-xylulose-5-phosphate reductoisomerase